MQPVTVAAEELRGTCSVLYIFSGETLHRRAKYEPSIIQKVCLVACTKKRVTVIAILTCVVILAVAVLVTVTHDNKAGSSVSCGSQVTESGTDQSQSTKKPAVPTYISTNGKPFPYHNIRLPTSVKPLHYHISLKTNISGSTFGGSVTIQCSIEEDKTDAIVIHVKDLNIKNVKVQNNATKEDLSVTEHLIYEENEQMYVKMASEMMKGMVVALKIEYDAELRTNLSGFYKSMYKTNDGEKRYFCY